jgi:hypothetical protein
VHVQQDHVGPGAADAVDGRVDLAGLADDLELGPQLGPQPREEEMVVVDQEHLGHRGSPLGFPEPLRIIAGSSVDEAGPRCPHRGWR